MWMYIYRFFGYTMVYTIKSLKRFHFTYHNTRKYTDITDPVGWTFCEQSLVTVDTSSAAKRPTPATSQTLPGSFTPALSEQLQGGQRTMIYGMVLCPVRKVSPLPTGEWLIHMENLNIFLKSKFPFPIWLLFVIFSCSSHPSFR